MIIEKCSIFKVCSLCLYFVEILFFGSKYPDAEKFGNLYYIDRSMYKYLIFNNEIYIQRETHCTKLLLLQFFLYKNLYLDITLLKRNEHLSTLIK